MCYHMLLLAASPALVSVTFNWKNWLPEETALSISANQCFFFLCARWLVSSSCRCGVPALNCSLALLLFFCFFSFQKRLSAASTRLAAPPVVFFSRRLGTRGKVWLEQLVALATLCATAADWNRNWPIHVSLQAGSGPCLVLTDYLISIQTARVSAPLLRSLEKRPRPASF